MKNNIVSFINKTTDAITISIAFAVIGRNTQILGDIIQKRMIQKIKRSTVMKEAKLKNAA